MQDLSLALERFGILITPGKAEHSPIHSLNLLESSRSTRNKFDTARL